MNQSEGRREEPELGMFEAGGDSVHYSPWGVGGQQGFKVGPVRAVFSCFIEASRLRHQAGRDFNKEGCGLTTINLLFKSLVSSESTVMLERYRTVGVCPEPRGHFNDRLIYTPSAETAGHSSH